MGTEKIHGKILFVDDEKNIIRSLQRAFFDTDFEVHTALSGEEGLSLLESTSSFDIVVSDYKMPGMNGVEFLEQIRKKWPHINRIFLSGYVEMDVVVRSIISGLVSNYFIKPWNDEFLVNSFSHLMRVRKILHSKSILSMISSFGQLPVLPKTYNQFLEGIEKDLSARKLAEIIEQDTSLSTKLLQLTNTAFYNLRGKRSVFNTLVTLGLSAVKNILLMISLENAQHLTEWQHSELQKIFNHSAMVNHYIQKFYEIIYEKKIDTSIGITHDIGKILYIMQLPEYYKNIVAKLSDDPVLSYYDIENKIVENNIDHTVVGAYLLDFWNLPQENIEGALFHHDGDFSSSQYAELLEVLTLCNCLVQHKERGISLSDVRLPEAVAGKFSDKELLLFYDKVEVKNER